MDTAFTTLITLSSSIANLVETLQANQIGGWQLVILVICVAVMPLAWRK